ncbi:MAG: hypothetical protein TEF_03525 [Rhizobiales bacterium NRL2]|jgi:enamine deaminase RidA (YjgF/YER057c/UK114 family)|nr:MAG: hypothetical protein TEF_03525 [Rhizobiales bacterium NRL2]
MNKVLEPKGHANPGSRFAPGMEVPPDCRWCFISGQVGLDCDGNIPDDIDRQIHVAFDNVFAILAEADMSVADVVRLNIYLTDAGDVAAYRRIRDERMEGRLTASTLVVVSALVDPRMRVEIEAVAAEMSSPGRAA